MTRTRDPRITKAAPAPAGKPCGQRLWASFRRGLAPQPSPFPVWPEGVLRAFPKLRALTWETPKFRPAPYLRRVGSEGREPGSLNLAYPCHGRSPYGLGRGSKGGDVTDEGLGESDADSVAFGDAEPPDHDAARCDATLDVSRPFAGNICPKIKRAAIRRDGSRWGPFPRHWGRRLRAPAHRCRHSRH